MSHRFQVLLTRVRTILWQKGRKLTFARERGARPVIKVTVVGNFKRLKQSSHPNDTPKGLKATRTA